MRLALAFLALVLLLGAGPADDQAHLLSVGKEVFTTICADCHRLNGEGLPGTFPALNGDPFVVGDPKPVIKTVLNGRHGMLGHMPTWKDKLNDEQIAGAITYVRQAWSNHAGPVTPAMVAALRGK